jgi:hypothetical protein
VYPNRPSKNHRADRAGQIHAVHILPETPPSSLPETTAQEAGSDVHRSRDACLTVDEYRFFISDADGVPPDKRTVLDYPGVPCRQRDLLHDLCSLLL